MQNFAQENPHISAFMEIAGLWPLTPGVWLGQPVALAPVLLRV
jgi:hypothetical protein